MSLANIYRYAYDIEGSTEKAFYEQAAAEVNDIEALRSIAWIISMDTQKEKQYSYGV